MSEYLAAICLVLIISMAAAQTDLFIEEGPRNALKRVGESNMLGCVTINNDCRQIEWQKVEGAQSPKLVYRNSSGMLNGLLFPPARYSVSDDKGCNLTITGLQVGDSGRFICVQSIGDREQTKTAVLIVIDVTDSCLANVTSSDLVKGDGYSLQCAIVTPAKSVEPVSVTLSFQNKAVGETEAIDSQPQAIRTTLTGTANTKAIASQECWVSFAAVNEPNYDVYGPSLRVCTSQQLNVSYPVEGISVSDSHSKGDTVTCSAEGYPAPTFTWTNLQTEMVVETIDTMVINGENGDKFNCTATNKVKGRVHSQSITIQVSEKPPPPPAASCGSGCIATITVVLVIITIVGTIFTCWWIAACPLHKRLRTITSDKGEKHGVQSEPLTRTGTGTGPTKPPRVGDPAPKRPGSECNYAELRPDPNPHQMKPNPVNNSSTVYASVLAA